MPSNHSSTRARPTLKPRRAALGLLQGHVPGDGDVVQVDGAEALLVRGPDVLHAARVDADDGAAHGVEGGLVVAHDDQPEVERNGREHRALPGDDGVHGDEARLDHVLQVHDLGVQAVVVVDHAVPVVLDADEVLHREGHRGPGVRLELGAVDEEVGGHDGTRDEHGVAAACPRGGAGPRPAAPRRSRSGGCPSCRMTRSKPEPAYANRVGIVTPLRSPTASPVMRPSSLSFRASTTPSKNSARVCECGEQPAAGHEVRLDQRAPLRAQAELLHALADDAPDARHVVRRAGAQDHARARPSRGAGVGLMSPSRAGSAA